MADLFREVDDAMRQERLAKIWAENRIYIIGFVLGTILLTGIISGYNSWNNAVREKQTATLFAMQDDAGYPENILNSEKLKMRGGLRGVALIRAASAFLDQDKPDEALTLYTRASEDNGLPNELQHLGTLMIVRLQMNKDDQDAQALLGALKPVLKDSKSPWIHHARLEAAVILARLLDDKAAAIGHLNKIQDTKGLPETLYARANALSHIYAMDQEAAPEKTKETTQ